MRTKAPNQFTTIREEMRAGDAERYRGKPQTRRAILCSRPPPNELIESDEFEWITPLNLPGLIVSPRNVKHVETQQASPMRRSLDDVLETEDGDATSCCQLPGALGIDTDIQALDMSAAHTLDDADGADEYAEIAAMQLPGRLIEQRAAIEDFAEHAKVRGLCATCVHRDVCDFPRPGSGVWRCEEYA
jgi:hypothetical protein